MKDEKGVAPDGGSGKAHGLTRLENRETCGTRPEMGPTRLERTKSTELFRSRHGCRLSEEPFRPTTLC